MRSKEGSWTSLFLRAAAGSRPRLSYNHLLLSDVYQARGAEAQGPGPGGVCNPYACQGAWADSEVFRRRGSQSHELRLAPTSPPLRPTFTIDARNSLS